MGMIIINNSYYIFLDIDGVLNRERDWKRGLYSLNAECVNFFLAYLEKLKNPRVVLISTWRNGDGIKELELYFSIYDRTPNSDNGRQSEIEYYIRRNEVKEYIIIDDDASLYYAPEKVKIYIPDYKTGLTQKDIKILLRNRK